jgi:hypothetical protein
MGDQATSSPIEVRVDELSQLFDTLDPFPFRERDLDKDAEEYIVGWAREFPRDQPISIVIHAPADELKGEYADQMGPALNRYFAYRAEIIARDLNELFRIGRQSLLIGVTVLAACVLVSRAAVAALGSGNVGRFMEEGLIILGWVCELETNRDFPVRLVAAGKTPRSLSPPGGGERGVEAGSVLVSAHWASGKTENAPPDDRRGAWRLLRTADTPGR